MKTHGKLIRTAAGWHVLAAPYVMVKAKRLFPRAEPSRSGAIAISDTPETCRDLEWLCDRYPLEGEGLDFVYLRARADQHRRTEEAVERILAGDVADRQLREPAREPRPHQTIAAELALETGRLLLVDEVGLGKTMSALLVLREPEALPAVVVCYPHLTRQWCIEVEKTLPWLRTHVVSRMEPYDPSQRRGAKGRPDIVIVPWSKIRGWGDHLRGEARTVIFDEAQELRLTTSQKYTASASVSDLAAFRLGLTATPIYNYGGEIHSVVNAIAPDVLGSRSEFLREWCGGADDSGLSGTKARVQDPAALGLYLREQGVFLRRTRKEIGRELPEALPVPHVVDTDDDLLDRISGDVVELADLILARDTGRTERFRASGELDWRMRRATGLAKAPYVADFVRLLLESEERVLLYGWHRDVYDQWRHRLADLKPVFYTGTESPTQKHAAFTAFTEGDARVLIASLRAGAGLDGLQEACRVCVFGELDWSPGIHRQCIGRLHRDGQADPVVAYFLIAEDGSDPVVAEVLNVKRMQSDPLIDPNAEALEAAVGTEDRIRSLAQAVRSRHRSG